MKQYDLDISFVTHSKLCKDTNKEQLNRLLEGDTSWNYNSYKEKPFNDCRPKKSKKGIAM